MQGGVVYWHYKIYYSLGVGLKSLVSKYKTQFYD
jgi:hypothetical protein